MWSTGEGNGKPLQYSCLQNSMNSMKRQKDRTLKDELPRLVGTQSATGDKWRNNSRKNEELEPRQKQHPVVDVTGDRSKVQCYKEQYCIETWNIRSMNQGKLEVVKQKIAGVKSIFYELAKWIGLEGVNLTQMTNIYYCRQESLRRNGVALIVKKRVWNAVIWCSLKKELSLFISKANYSIS